MARRTFKTIFIAGLAALGLTLFMIASCGSYGESKEARARMAAEARGPIYIAVVWPTEGNQYPMINGVTLAVDELNRAGGVLGREVKMVLFEETADDAHDIARRIAKNPEIVAVVGHITSTSAIKASITYEECGILFMAPSATNPVLTAHSFDFVFRTTPSDIVIGQQLARFTSDRGYQRIVILDDNTIFGSGLAATYHAMAADLGRTIVSHKAYFPWQTDFKSLANQYTKSDVDAIFLAGGMPHAAILIKQFRAMGIDAPFIAGDSLDTLALPLIAGPAADGTIVPTVFNPYVDDPDIQRFVNAFKTEYDSNPANWDALGYDTIKLLAFAFEKSGSTVPIIAASTLRVTSQWKGVTGDFTFDTAGDLEQKPMHFKEVKNGQFEYIKE